MIQSKLILLMTSQALTYEQFSGNQSQHYNNKSDSDFYNFEPQPKYVIFKKSQLCDIFFPCRKNEFQKQESDDKNKKEWTIIEESNYCKNYFCYQYRQFKLSAEYIKGNIKMKYVGESKNEQYLGSKNVLFCQDKLMEIKKYGANNVIGEIYAISSVFEEEFKAQQRRSRPLIKIVQNGQDQVFVITLKQGIQLDYYLRQCCLPYDIIEYEIWGNKIEEVEGFQQIGLITKQFNGCFKQYCTRGEKFDINMYDNFYNTDKIKAQLEIDPKKKYNHLDKEALLMFGCLQLNYQEYEQMIHLP